MLKISSEQIRVFQPDADGAFVARVADYLRENHADTVFHWQKTRSTVAEIESETLRALVRGGLERAAGHRIAWRSTRLSFVVLMFLTAPNFDEHPKAARFFAETETVDDAAFENFLDEMTDDDWTLVEQNYDETAWTPVFVSNNGSETEKQAA